VSTVDEVVGAVPAPVVLEHRPWWRSRLVLSALVVVGMLAGYYAAKGKYAWPAVLEWGSLQTHLDSFQIWLSDQSNATSPNLFFRIVNGISGGLDTLVRWLYDALTKLTWVGTTTVATLVAWRFGGLRAAAFMAGGLASFAAFGLWDESMQTLSLVLAAVALSLAVGLPLGIAAGRSERFDRALTPVLDAMQIIPAFAYLMPVVILFSVGPGAAVITTMIYSVPPAVRIASLGIRGVPSNTVEAAKALGSTGSQLLWKVQLPLARRMLLLAVNQTILFALSMVVIAGLIGGSGLGDPVTNGLNTNPAVAILAGAAIVIMAIMLDRVTEAVAERTDPTRRHLDEAGRRHARRTTVGVIGASAVAIGVGFAAHAGDTYTRYTISDWLLARVQSVLDYIADPTTFLFQHITNPLGDFLTQHILLPLDTFLVATPWFVTVAGFVTIALILSGLRPALVTAAMLGLIGVVGEWQSAMDTASQVLVATVISVALGILLGVWAAESEKVSRILRPINDILQTLPQLVYVIPFVYLFPISYVPGMIASVLYAFPVVVRLVERGVRDVAPQAVEAAGAFGATRRQVLLKVKIPLARDAIMLGVNQGIIMVLAVVVIAGLASTPGLGYEVVQGLQRNEFGLGVVASIAILALGIALDRVTKGNQSNRRTRADVS
jgi:glycine betaine/proline transport system permease protein